MESGCVWAPRRYAVRPSPRSWPGTTRRLRQAKVSAAFIPQWNGIGLRMGTSALRGSTITEILAGYDEEAETSQGVGGIHSTVEWNQAAYGHLGVTRFDHHRDPGRVRRGG